MQVKYNLCSLILGILVNEIPPFSFKIVPPPGGVLNSFQEITLPCVICTDDQRDRRQSALRINEGTIILKMDISDTEHGLVEIERAQRPARCARCKLKTDH